MYFDSDLYRAAVQTAPGTDPLEDFLAAGIIPDPILSPFNYMHTQRFRDACERAAAKIPVVGDVAPSDLTMGYALFHESNAGKPEAAVEYYFWDGARSANGFADLIYNDLGLNRDAKFSLLEFASGYGRVTRHWHQHIHANVTVCDIHEAAVDFVAKRFGIPAVQSALVPEELSLPGRYDVIFCLSFFTHMPERTWERWFNALFDAVSPGGHLIFTTHGDTCARIRNVDVPPGMLYFTPETEQYDIDTADYGYTIVGQQFVEAVVSRRPDASFKAFKPDFFWNIQDTYCVKKQV